MADEVGRLTLICAIRIMGHQLLHMIFSKTVDIHACAEQNGVAGLRLAYGTEKDFGRIASCGFGSLGHAQANLRDTFFHKACSGICIHNYISL